MPPNIEELKKNRDVNGLISTIKNHKTGAEELIVFNAIEALIKIGKNALNPLIQALDKDNEGKINFYLGEAISTILINYLLFDYVQSPSSLLVEFPNPMGYIKIPITSREKQELILVGLVAHNKYLEILDPHELPGFYEFWTFRLGILHQMLADYQDKIENLKLAIKCFETCARVGNPMFKAEKIEERKSRILMEVSVIYFDLSQLEDKIKNIEKAIEASKKSLEHLDLNKTHHIEQYVQIQLNLGHYYWQLANIGNLQDTTLINHAINANENALEHNPNSKMALYNIGVMHTQIGNLDEAIYFLEKHLDNMPQNKNGWLLLGSVYAKKLDYHKAIYAYEKFTELDPDSEKVWGFLRDLWRELGTWPKVLECIKNLVRINPKNSDNWNDMGLTFSKMNQIEESMRAYRKAVQMDPKNYRAWVGLAYCHGERLEYEKDVECCEKALKIAPNYVKALYNIGLAKIKIGSLTGDIEFFKSANFYCKKLIQIDPRHVDGWLNFGVSYGGINDLQNANKCFQKAVELDHQRIESWFNLGLSYEQLENLQQALRCYDEILKIDPFSAGAWYDKSIILKRFGKIDEANYCYLRALELDPHIED